VLRLRSIEFLRIRRKLGQEIFWRCITAGIANISAIDGVTLHEVESVAEGDIGLRGDGPPEKLREIVEQSRSRSAVVDVLTNGVPVAVSIEVN
jgi:hypothetical protein